MFNNWKEGLKNFIERYEREKNWSEDREEEMGRKISALYNHLELEEYEIVPLAKKK